jgi:hydrogenase expression/formation protein HypC
MCLGVPAEILSIQDRSLMTTGWVDFGGVRREVCLELVPEARPGDYVIVHAGFAISWLDKEQAEEMLALLDQDQIAEAALADPGLSTSQVLRSAANANGLDKDA